MTPAKQRFCAMLGAAAVAVLVIAVAGRLLFFRPAGTGVEPPRAGTERIVSWQDAAEHLGAVCTVEGTVVKTHNSGKACFLNFHPNWKEHFTAVIFARSFNRFPPAPEQHYLGKRVRVSGLVKEYQGKPVIVLEEPSQIDVLD